MVGDASFLEQDYAFSGKYSPFEKQLLACPLALTEANHLTMDYDAIVQSKRSTVLSGPPTR